MKHALAAFGFLFLLTLVANAAQSPVFPFQGGTGTTSTPTNNQVLIGDGTGIYTLVAIPDCTGANKILFNSSTRTFSCSADLTGGGAGTITLNQISTSTYLIQAGSGIQVASSTLPDGTGVITITNTGVGAGVVNGTGTTNFYAIFTGASTLGTSTLQQSGTTLLQGGALNASGTITQNGAILLVAPNNLSDLTNSSTARTNLGLNNTNQSCSAQNFVISLSATTTIGCGPVTGFVNGTGTAGQVAYFASAQGVTSSLSLTWDNTTLNLTAPTGTFTNVKVGSLSGLLKAVSGYIQQAVSNVDYQAVIATGTTSQYFKGDFSLGTFQTDVRAQFSAGTNIVISGGAISVTSTPSFSTTTVTYLVLSNNTSTLLRTDSSGNVVQYTLQDCGGGNFVRTISASGTVGCAADSVGAGGTNAATGTPNGVAFFDTANHVTSSLLFTWATSTGLFSAPSSSFTNASVTTALTIPKDVSLDSSGEISISVTTGTFNWYNTRQHAISDVICSAYYTVQNVTSSPTYLPVHTFDTTSTLMSVKAFNTFDSGNVLGFNVQWGVSAVAASSTADHHAFINTTSTNATSTPKQWTSGFASSSISMGDTMTFFYGEGSSSTQASVEACWRANP